MQLNPANGELLVNVQRDALGQIVSGLVVGPVTAQNQAVLLRESPGAFKGSPLTGVGVASMLMDEDLLSWNTAIKKQLVADGQQVESVTITQTEIIINASYPS